MEGRTAGITGAALLAVGCVLPIYSGTGSASGTVYRLISNNPPNCQVTQVPVGWVVFVLALSALVLALLKRPHFARLPGVLSLLLVGHTYFAWRDMIAKTKATCAICTASQLSMGSGWILLIAGIVILGAFARRPTPTGDDQ